MANIKRWVWWKIHKKPIMSLVGKLIHLLMEKIEGLDSVSFKLDSEVYEFHKPSKSEVVS